MAWAGITLVKPACNVMVTSAVAPSAIAPKGHVTTREFALQLPCDVESDLMEAAPVKFTCKVTFWASVPVLVTLKM